MSPAWPGIKLKRLFFLFHWRLKNKLEWVKY
jgi:hypothetical protein